MTPARDRRRRCFTGPAWTLCCAILGVVIARAPAAAQIAKLVSPGPLSRAHASLEGASCEKCHEPGRKVPAVRCLQCHQPVAERMKARRGVHRAVTTDCAPCHTEHAGRDAELRPFDQSRFDHLAETGFLLDGRHKTIPCAACHKARSFLTVKPACTSCHADPHRGRLGPACIECHSAKAPFTQVSATFDHSRTAFPLVGAHQTVACARCHVNKVYKGVRFAQCTDCHRTPHRRVLGSACTACHTPQTWKTQKIDHAVTGFPLRGKHATVACERCHVKPATRAALKFQRCADCHADPHRGQFKQDCGACHQETGFAKAGFDHSTTKFPLTGRHIGVTCAACHKNAAAALAAKPAKPATTGKAEPNPAVDFRGLSTSCASCHKDPHLGQLGPSCEQCHSTAGEKFAAVGFSHDRAAFRLAGLHRTVPCAGCHKTETAPYPAGAGSAVRYKGLGQACAACHKDPHLGQVGTVCEGCHTVDTKYLPDRFSHTRAKFALDGRHADLACDKCHKRETGSFPAGSGTAVRLTGLATACQGCHTDPHIGQLGAQCEGCHTTATFRLISYAHKPPAKALFTGRHAALVCGDCHKREEAAYPAGKGVAVRYAGIGTACVACHRDPHAGAFGTGCSACHAPESWRVTSRGFHQASHFPLEGRHLTVPCTSCHLNNVYQGTPTACYDCHWIRRQDDRYRTRLGSQCQDCHRPISWTAVRWDHGAATGMPLTAPHRALGCESCHPSQRFEGTPTECVSCHMADYQRTTNPNHAAAGFPTQCDLCHKPSQSSWDQASFNHTSFYPLVGVHATQPCSACHKNNVYAGTPTDCYGCHRADYQNAKNPNHVAAGFPTTCQDCHQPSAPSWNTSFNHNAVFPLVGVHATQPCTACHKNNVFGGTPTECYGCHQADYQNAKDPNHVAAGFPTTCEACHQASAPNWNASFNHAAVFPLVGVHATQPCTACHKNNVFAGTPTDCYGCHQADYQRATDPNHIAAGFPTTCNSCHKATDPSWDQGVFVHTAFPITSGRHAGIACPVCHINNTNYQVFSCINGCHPRATTDADHTGVAGYRYDSLACYACHPRGVAGRPTALLPVPSHPRASGVGVRLFASHNPTPLPPIAMGVRTGR